MAAILNLAILHSAILVLPLKLTHTCQDWIPPFAQKNLHSSFWLNLMMASILNSTILGSDTAILDSDTFLSSLRFTQKHSPSTLTLTQTNSIWLTWWWQPSWILPSWILPYWIQPFCTKLWLKLIQSDSNSSILTQLDDGSHLEFYHVGLRHCHFGFRHLLIFSQIHSKTLSLHSDSWLKLIQSDSNLFLLTQLDDGSHLEFHHLGFSHLSYSSQTHSHLPRLLPTICTKKPSLIHSDSTWWWQPSWILPCWIEKTTLIHSDSTWWWQSSWILPCWIQTPCFLLSDLLKNTLTPLWLWLKQIQSDSNLFLLTQLDDGSPLEFHHLGFSHLSYSSQTHSHLSRLVPTICTKKPSLIHSDSTWWWHPSWILPCWIQTLPSRIQRPSYLLSDSLQNTLPVLWLWLKLIQSD